MPFPLRRGRYQALSSLTAGLGLAGKLPVSARCGTRRLKASGTYGSGATGECRRPNTSFYKQALHELRGLTQRDCPGLPGHGRCLDGLHRRPRPLQQPPPAAVAPSRPAPRPD